jgi:hypothetical protein
MSSSGGDVDKVLVEEDIKGYVRHWETGVRSLSQDSTEHVVSKDLKR